jgi:hypothetical protein
VTQFANAMSVFTLLPKTNCKKCNETTCLAFASKVFLGQKKLDLCPYIDPDVADEYKDRSVKESLVEQQQMQMIQHLKQQISRCDLNEAAQRTGGVFSDAKLTLRIFGKPFSIDRDGRMVSDIHINPWITSTVMGYVLHCRGAELTGRWVPFRELEGGREKNGLFVQRSETSFKNIADRHTGLFEDLIHIFNGKRTDNRFESDISIILHPLPLLPILVCYWKADEGMPSDHHLFFDSSANQNAGIDIVYSIAAGIVVMFEKIALRHGG